MTVHEELNEIATQLREGKTARPVSIRTFLSWFDVQRRTTNNVYYIDEQLRKVGIQTVPHYLNTWVGNPIGFELATEKEEPSSGDKRSWEQEGNSAQDEQLAHNSSDDPSFKIGKVLTPESIPVSVKPNATLQEATTIMLSRDFSQLPVMTTEREVKGVVSWSSIGARIAANIVGPDVQSYMDDAREIAASATFFDAIRAITESDYVLVRDATRRVIGIVTASDIAQQFEAISTPFLLLAEIENHLRYLVSVKLSKSDIKRACSAEHLPKDFSSTSELTFGNLVRVLDHTDNWKKTGIKLDKGTFCSELMQINDIRNDVMHFDPDPLTTQNMNSLRNVSRMFDKLRQMGAF